MKVLARVLRAGPPAALLLIAAALLPASAQAHWIPTAGGWGLGGGAFGWSAASALQEPVDAVADLPRIGHEPCVKGFAGPFRCHKAQLMSFLPMRDIGGGPSSIYGGPGNDVWGWTDPQTGKEWVIAGRSDGTSFIDASDPKNPVFVANLPAAG